MRTPIDSSLASVLDGVPGLTGVSMTPQFDLWRLTDLPARVSVLEQNGTVVPVAAGPVGVAGASVPAAGGTVLLAEPAGNWSASVNGHGADAGRVAGRKLGPGVQAAARRRHADDQQERAAARSGDGAGVAGIRGRRRARPAGHPHGGRDGGRGRRGRDGTGRPGERRRRGTVTRRASWPRRGGDEREPVLVGAGRRRAAQPSQPGEAGTATQPGPASQPGRADRAGRGAKPGRSRGIARRAARGSAGPGAVHGPRGPIATRIWRRPSAALAAGLEITDVAAAYRCPGALVADSLPVAARRPPGTLPQRAPAPAAAAGRELAAAGGAAVGGAGTEVFAAGAAGGRRAARAGGPPGAAWPAGQPASRFISDPPDDPAAVSRPA